VDIYLDNISNVGAFFQKTCVGGEERRERKGEERTGNGRKTERNGKDRTGGGRREEGRRDHYET
jgi:hypothetical protein